MPHQVTNSNGLLISKRIHFSRIQNWQLSGSYQREHVSIVHLCRNTEETDSRVDRQVEAELPPKMFVQAF